MYAGQWALCKLMNEELEQNEDSPANTILFVYGCAPLALPPPQSLCCVVQNHNRGLGPGSSLPSSSSLSLSLSSPAAAMTFPMPAAEAASTSSTMSTSSISEIESLSKPANRFQRRFYESAKIAEIEHSQNVARAHWELGVGSSSSRLFSHQLSRTSSADGSPVARSCV